MLIHTNYLKTAQPILIFFHQKCVSGISDNYKKRVKNVYMFLTENAKNDFLVQLDPPYALKCKQPNLPTES